MKRAFIKKERIGSLRKKVGHFALLPTKLFAAFVLLASLSVEAFADDWPQWLGSKRGGVWREKGILESIPDEGPKVVWRQKINSGYSGPAVADGKLFVTDRVTQSSDPTTQQDDHYARRPGPGTERVLCFRESDGEILWKHEYDCPYSIAYPAGPRATPTVHLGKVYTLGAQGDLFCLNANTGKEIWSCDFKKEYDLKAPTWGFAAHPLIDGDHLAVNSRAIRRRLFIRLAIRDS